MSEIGRLAQEVVENELPFLTGTDQSVAISRASGWFLNNLGQLNNLIFSSYSGENPGMYYEESSIIKLLYLRSYYKGKVGSVLNGMDSSTLEWISLAEGDSRIQRQNKNEVAKTYNMLANELRSDIDKLIWTYNQYQAYPRSVDIVYEEPSETEDNPIVFEVIPYTVNGYADIPSGQNFVQISADIPANPEKISIALVKPSQTSPNVSFSVVGTSMTTTGFLVSLGGTISQTGYRINYGIK